MTANEQRKAAVEKYKEILGRNYYSQGSEKRQCVFHPYKDGKYYSDCSSSILNAYYETGILSWHEGNTATIHEKGINVNVDIVNGIVNEAQLRPADCLLFRGNDPGRPLQIGHVELYAGNGKLYGHGSDRPSEKDLNTYLKAREKQKASNGMTKGLVEVRRFIPDDEIEIPISGTLRVTEDLNYRDQPGGVILGVFKKDSIVQVDTKLNRWFHIPGRGWCSARYLNGWVQENGRWWYLMPGYTWPEKTVMEIGGDEYAFDHNGWMITADRIDEDGFILYK